MILTVASTVALGSLFAGVPTEVKAEDKIEELKKEEVQVQGERSNVESNIDEANKEILRLQGEQANVQSELNRLDVAVSDTLAKIEEKTKQIEDTNIEIEKLQAEIVVLIERINKRNEMLKDRARNFQETGGMVSYLDVLVGAKSFGDFVDRASAVATIVEADQDILKQHQADKDMLEQKQTKVKTELASLEKMRGDLEGMKEKLNSQISEQNTLLSSLEEHEHEVHEQKLSLEEENQILASQESAIQMAIQMEAQRQEEEKQAALAAAAAAEAAKTVKASTNNTNGGGSGGGSTPSPVTTAPPVTTTPPVSNGAFTKPASGRFSSGFGYRDGGMHYGVDIANKGSNVPIVAAAAGVVSQSYMSSSYGNVVFISHSINGQVYTTLYAHMTSRGVSAGTVVSKGQFIGTMGNTGQSFGQHLHFELHRGPWNSAKSNAINPVGIVPL